MPSITFYAGINMFSFENIQYASINKRTPKSRVFKCIVLTLFGFFALPIHAELQSLSELELAQVSGQSGLTIDIETKVSVGEIEYVDAGSMFWRDYSLTGIGGGLVDNIRAKIDSTNGQEILDIGFSDIARLASMGYLDASENDVAWAISEYSNGSGEFGKEFKDGDLVIHITSKDYGIDFLKNPSSADHSTNLSALKNAVDFHLQQGEFGIRSSDKTIETILSRNFSVEAYLGYLDIILTNKGNGYHDTSVSKTQGEPQNILLADSYIDLDLKFRVEDLDIDSTNNVSNPMLPMFVQNPYLTIRDMRIHNERGQDTLGSFGFASVKTKIGAASKILKTMDKLTESDSYVDGQAIYAVNVNWDWDLPHISFGDTGETIGSVYLTDFQIKNTSLVISAH